MRVRLVGSQKRRGLLTVLNTWNSASAVQLGHGDIVHFGTATTQ